MSIKKLLIPILIVLIVGIMMLCESKVYADEECEITSISASNYGSYVGTTLWINCGASINSFDDNDTVQFFLCSNDGDEIDEAIIKGTPCRVKNVPSANDYVALRSAKNENGFLIDSDLKAGEYYIGCMLQSGEKTVYAYQSFRIFNTAKEYIKTGLDTIIRSYEDSWFVLKKKYVGLGKITDDYGNDWEAWIFPTLGSDYLLDGENLSFDINGSFLSSYDGLTYLDQLKNTIQTIERNGELENQGTKQLFKWITALASCGKDPRDFEGYNLVQLMIDYAYNENGTPAIDKDGALTIPERFETSDDILFISYELLGLEIAGAKPAEGYTDEIRKAGIRKILSIYGADKIENGSQIASDWYSMAMLPLMFIKTNEIYHDDCVNAIEKYKSIICDSYTGSNGAMTYNPITESADDIWNRSNANTESVAINTLVAYGASADSFKSASYQKQYGNLLTALCGDIVEGGVLYGGFVNRMATYQTLGALVDLYNGKSCFEIAHEEYQQNYPQYFTDNYGKLSITFVSAIADQKYTGNPITPEISVIGKKYGRSADTKGELTEDVDYTVEFKDNIEPGKATVVITGIGDYYGTIEASFNIIKEDEPVVVVKKKQPMTVKPVSKIVSFKKLKKKAQVVKGALIVKNNKGNVSYKKISGSKKLTINKKTGRITVKKKTKKGTYKIRVKVTAAGDSLFKAGSRTVTVKIRVA